MGGVLPGLMRSTVVTSDGTSDRLDDGGVSSECVGNIEKKARGNVKNPEVHLSAVSKVLEFTEETDLHFLDVSLQPTHLIQTIRIADELI